MSARKLAVFNSVTLDGYFTGPGGDLSWAHRNQDAEWTDFVSGNAQGESTMVFGRITYEMMAAWWPTPQAIKSMPGVADRMNQASKVVFSRSLKNAAWNNTQVVATDPVAAIQEMKQEPGPDLVIFGSGTIIALLAENGLIDEYQLVFVPVVLGHGRTMFAGVTKQPELRLTKTRTFANGNAFLCYSLANRRLE